MELAVISLLIVFIVREYAHQLHDKRRDALISELTDKLKASSFTEYKEQTTPPQTFEPVSKDDKELYWQEIEEAKQ